MNDSDHSLDRLLRSAAQSGCSTVGAEPPFGFTTRVVSGWLGSARERTGLEVIWFRRSLICAIAVMAISVGWSFKADTSSSNEEVAIASYDATLDVP